MSRYIVAHTAPMTEQQVNEMLKSPPNFPAGIACHYTWFDFSAGKFFCEWEAPNKESVEQSIRAMNMPFDVVYPVRRLAWATGQLEPAP